MQNVINELPSKVSPVAMAAGSPDGLKVGHVSHADDLFKAFTADVFETSKLSVLRTMAITAGLTCEEFKAECKRAQAKADETDALTGFVKEAGAKGQYQYGPTRRVLNSRLGEAKNLFGVFKQAPDILKEKGYVAALSIAREFLAEKGVKWDGSKATTEEQKQAKARVAAVAEAMGTTAKNEGETREEWLIRVDELATEKLAQAEEEVFNKGVKKLYDSLTEKHDDKTLSAVLQMVIDSLDDEGLNSMKAYIDSKLA
jgi:hypothetical protein